MNGVAILELLAGLVLLTAGGEALVRGASRLATAMGISPVVIGLTVVAFGTSAPEMAVSTVAALHANPDIAVGNVVGSNIFNVLFILGVSALILPLAVAQKLVRADVPLLIGASCLAWYLAADGVVGRAEGLFLFGLLLGYTALTVVMGRREGAEIQEEYRAEFGKPPRRSPLWSVGVIAAGLAILVVGSDLLVDGAVAVARGLGVSEVVIGLTIVAAGTSLPEVAASVMAAIHGERDIAVGNVVGSNLFNLLGVLGLAGALSPTGVAVSAASLRVDFPVMVGVAVACLPILFTGFRIDRWEGGIFLGLYAGYVSWLLLDATGQPVAHAVGRVMLFGVVPLVVLILAVSSWRSVRRIAGPPGAGSR